jgi:hypothetical protein
MVKDFNFRGIKSAIALVSYLIDVVANSAEFEIGVCIHLCFGQWATPQQPSDGVRPGQIVGFSQAIQCLKIFIVDSDLKT